MAIELVMVTSDFKIAYQSYGNIHLYWVKKGSTIVTLNSLLTLCCFWIGSWTFCLLSRTVCTLYCVLISCLNHQTYDVK